MDARKFPLSPAIGAAFGGWLLFFSQPLTGKWATPLIGGSPSGWLTIMLWFQGCLLLGNLLALALRKTPQTFQTSLLLAAALLGLGLTASPHVSPTGLQIQGFPSLLGLIISLAGLTPIALGAVTATLAKNASARNLDAQPVYFWANAGALLGLLSGLTCDIFLDLHITALLQPIGWAGLALATAACLKKSTAPQEALPPKEEPTNGLARTALLAALGCSLLTTSTSRLATDIGSSPISWIPPLLVFLTSYIAAFSHRHFPSSTKAQIPTQIACAVILLITLCLPGANLTSSLILLAGTFIILYRIHKEIAENRPLKAQDQAAFTTAIGLGGLAGSALWVIGAPSLLPFDLDLPITIASILTATTQLSGKSSLHEKITMGICAAATFAALYFNLPETAGLAAIGIILALGFASSPKSLALSAGLCILLALAPSKSQAVLSQTRGVLGCVKVILYQTPQGETRRALIHGSTVHGEQRLSESGWDTTPLSYYNPEGPLGDFLHGKTLAIGMGAASLSGYKAPTTYIEIDPHVIEAAKTQFSFLEPFSQILQGDGRKIAESLQPHYDLIVLDAFSSDSIPTHLITQEAISTYCKLLAPDGRIAAHISNKFFNLEAPLAANAPQGFHTFAKEDRPPPDSDRKPSHWVLIQQNPKPPNPTWKKIPPTGAPLTDFKGSILPYLKLL